MHSNNPEPKIPQAFRELAQHLDNQIEVIKKKYAERWIDEDGAALDPELEALVIMAGEVTAKAVAKARAEVELLDEDQRRFIERRTREIAEAKALEEQPLSELEHKDRQALINILREMNQLDREKMGKSGRLRGGSVHEEIGEFGEIAQVEWGENSPISSNSSCTLSQMAVFPEDSILGDWYTFAITQCEGADCYVIGAILPIVGALLARAVWLPWSPSSLHTNLFSMLAGKAGDRKSSTIDLGEAIARKILPTEAFLPKAYSPETMFDEYDLEAGGRPDKVLICDDANATLADWQKSTNGERIASRFLELYDCKGLSESFRRNRSKKGGADTQRRSIPYTSTNVIFGATFSSCMFRNQAVRAGLQRRFLYYVAEGHGRVILWPAPNYARLEVLAASFGRLAKLSGPFKLSPDAKPIFDQYQHDNRDTIDSSDSFDEALRSRLSSAPVQVLKVAMIFEACRSVKTGSSELVIQASTLELAICHIAECLKASAALEAIAQRIYIKNDAEVLLAKIRIDFRVLAKQGSIILSRTDLTSKYAHNGKRGTSIDDIYLKQIPYLIQIGQAKALPKKGKLERYAFRVEG